MKVEEMNQEQLDQVEEKILALATNLDVNVEEIEEEYENTYNAEGGEYLVLTDDEAGILWDEYLDSYIDECIIPELPEHLQNYFDEESWKLDARMDGRAHSLATYDDDENCEEINSTGYYIYRTN